MTLEITTFGQRPQGGHVRQFAVRRIRVSVDPDDADNDEAAEQLALALARFAERKHTVWQRLESEAMAARTALEAAERELARLRGLVPPASPVRVLAPGFVRFDTQGRLWLLGHRETGWSSFGVLCADWDDLFRRYNVRIAAHGVDEFGPYWTAVPA